MAVFSPFLNNAHLMRECLYFVLIHRSKKCQGERESGCSPVWLSTNGLDVILLCSRRRRADAETDLQAVKAVLGSLDFYDERKVAALLQQLTARSDETPCPLPDDLVRQICREIVRTVAHRSPSI